MPCRDYMDDVDHSSTIRDMKERTDMLSRISCKALDSLDALNDGTLEALLLKDPEMHKWWIAHKEADRQAAEKLRKANEKRVAEEHRKEVAKSALAKLTPEEIKALGVK